MDGASIHNDIAIAVDLEVGPMEGGREEREEGRGGRE